MTVVNTPAEGFLRLYAADQPEPGTSVINFGVGTTRANNAAVGLDPSGALKVTNASVAPQNVVLDVVGYFGPGNDG